MDEDTDFWKFTAADAWATAVVFAGMAAFWAWPWLWLIVLPLGALWLVVCFTAGFLSALGELFRGDE